MMACIHLGTSQVHNDSHLCTDPLANVTVNLNQTNIAGCIHQNYVLAFSEDFDGDELNLAKWELQSWGQGTLTTDPVQSVLRLENIHVEDGICTLITDNQPVVAKVVNWMDDNAIMADGLPNLRTFPYTSSSIWSKYLYGHGRYEIRFRLDNKDGFFPAFWVFDNINGIWNELDFFEIETIEISTWTGTFHHDQDGDGGSEFCPNGYDNLVNFSQWNTLACEWDDYKATWYINGTEFFSRDLLWDTGGDVVDCCHDETLLIRKDWRPDSPMHIIFNNAIKPDQGGFSADYPVNYEIDYIRYYKKDGCCGDVVLENTSDIEFDPDPEGSNFICAETISISDNVTIGAGQNLSLVATESITIEPGVTISNNAFFTTDIQPEVTPCCDVDLTTPIPNVFTPNGDGVNDNYCVYVTGATSYNVHVFTAPQGAHVYSNSGPVPEGTELLCVWDGAQAFHGDQYAVIVEFYNDCIPADKPVYGTSIVQVFSENPMVPDFGDDLSGLVMQTSKAIADNPFYTQQSEELMSSIPQQTVNSVSLKDVERLPRLEWYTLQPNPAKDQFRLVAQYREWEFLGIQLFDAQGKKVSEMVANTRDNVDVDISDLTPGIYFVRLNGNSEVQTLKFIKE